MKNAIEKINQQTQTDDEQERLREKFIAAVENAQREITICKERFLIAWKAGIEKLGANYFKLKVDINDVTDKWQACPDYEAINKTILSKSRSQQVMMALMYSFYDSIDGQRLLEIIGISNFLDARAALDEEEIIIISELWLHYIGW